MNSPHTVIYAVIALMLFSSIVLILYVSIQNYFAVKKYNKHLQIDRVAQESLEYAFDPEEFEEVEFFKQAPVKNRA